MASYYLLYLVLYVISSIEKISLEWRLHPPSLYGMAMVNFRHGHGRVNSWIIDIPIYLFTQESIVQNLGDEFSEELQDLEEDCFVKFFDDDEKEWLKISDTKRIKYYSKCKEKLKMIKAGFKNLDESKKSGLGGVNLRLAQFYKEQSC